MIKDPTAAQDTLIESIKIVADGLISKLQFDTTIEGEITSIINLDAGTYKFKYNDGIFTAWADLQKGDAFDIGDRVYIKIPQGDFSKTPRYIEGLVSDVSLSANEINKLQNSISEISPSLEQFYYDVYLKDKNGKYQYDIEQGYVEITDENYDGQRYSLQKPEFNIKQGLIAGPDKKGIFLFGSPEVEYDASLGANISFQQYMNQNLLQINAEFQTTFVSTHTKGNYGLEFSFFIKDEAETNIATTQVRMDYNTFTGNPYLFTSWAEQDELFDIPVNSLLGIQYIKFFQENFNYDKEVQLDENGEIVKDENGETKYIENKETNNIFVKNVSIKFVEQKNLIDGVYYVNYKAINGQGFYKEGLTELTLEAQLIYNRKNILNKDNAVVYWYIKDPSITRGSEDYDDIIGVGWRKIPETTDQAKLTIQSGDVDFTNYYKFAIVYQTTVFISEEIPVHNLSSEGSYSIIQEATPDGIVLSVKAPESAEISTISWYKKYPDGQYMAVTAEGHKLKISADMNQVYMTYYCIVNSNIVLETSITNSTQVKDVTVTFDGEDNFKYDANGDISIEELEKAHSIHYKIIWEKNIGTQYKVSYSIGGEAIPQDNGLSPKNSMLKKLRVDNENTIWYNIEEKFRNNYINNTIRITITTFDGEEFYFDKEILFLKDGDQGTNGTSYIVMIRPIKNEDGTIKKETQYKYFTPNNTSGIPVAAFVYKDGQQINNDTENYEITYHWSASSAIQTSHPEGYLDMAQLINNSGEDVEAVRYINVQVTIKELFEPDDPLAPANKTISLSAFYPFDMVSNLNSGKIDLSRVPQYIQYSSSGYNPIFNNIDLLGYYSTDNNIGGDGDVLMTPTAITSNLQVQSISNGDETFRHRLKPSANFLGESDENNTMGVLKFTYGEVTVYRTIIMYLNTFGNEAINGWDGTSLKTNDGYVLAPQVGAGEKDGNNLFTGVVMGKDTNQQQIGLYGYQKGISTFGFKQNGTAYIGKSGYGRINFDGNQAIIYGENKDIGSGVNYMELTLAVPPRITEGEGVETDAQFQERWKATNAIYIKGANDTSVFSVNYNGEFVATNGTLTGTIHAKAGDIAGWYIGAVGTTTIDDDGKEVKVSETYGEKEGLGGKLYNTVNNGDLILGNSVITTFGVSNTGNINFSNSGALFDNKGNIVISNTLIAENIYLGQRARAFAFEVFDYRETEDAEGKTRTAIQKIGTMGMVYGATVGGNITYNLGLDTTGLKKSIVLDSGDAIRLSAMSSINLNGLNINIDAHVDGLNTGVITLTAEKIKVQGNLNVEGDLTIQDGLNVVNVGDTIQGILTRIENLENSLKSPIVQ